MIRALAQESAWVGTHENIFVLGPTGVGKSFVACALAQKACRDGYSALYTRAQSLFRDLAMARADGSLRSLLARLSRIDVLVIDDWAMAPLSEPERRDFWEICEDRYQVRSTILTSQLPVSRWHEQIGDPTAGRRHPRPAGSQRPSHRDARRFDAQESGRQTGALRFTHGAGCYYCFRMRAICSGLIGVWLVTLPSVAQDGTAGLTGKVKDITGAGVSGTQAELLSETVFDRRFRTSADSTGAYHFSGLPTDEYTLKLLSPGFEVANRQVDPYFGE